MDKFINVPDSTKKRVVIVGGGFAGITLAKGLGDSDYQVILLDKNNYHTFQPLLYQVATGGLEPDSIATPFRRILDDRRNVVFRMTEVLEVVPDQNLLITTIGKLHYDFLVIATGSRTNYFGMNDVKANGMPLKSMTDALDLRSMMLQNMECAVDIGNGQDQESLIDFVVVGGGPTGIEMAGALAELKNKVLPGDYAEIDFSRMDIYLVEMGPRLLAGMSEEASKKTLAFLQQMGVHVWLNTSLVSYDGFYAVFSNGQSIATSSLIYSAGVAGNTIEGIAPGCYTRGNRLKVNHHLLLDGYNNIFCVGDVAAMVTAEHPVPHAMVAPAAIQQAEHVVRYLKAIDPSMLRPFKYKNKGSMATIGRNKAVVDILFLRFQGVFAWFVWMFVHLMSLVCFRNRITVFVNWTLGYFTYDKRFRLIIRPYKKRKAIVE